MSSMSCRRGAAARSPCPASGPMTVPRRTPARVGAEASTGGAGPRAAGGSVGVRSSAGACSPLIAVKYAHVSKRSSFGAQGRAVDRRGAAGPTTWAAMIRGETPRSRHADALERPWTRAAELARARTTSSASSSSGGGARRCRTGRRRDISQGLGLVAERRVLDRLGLAAGGGEEVGDDRLAAVGDDLAAGVAATAAFVGAARARRLRQTWERVSAKWSKSALLAW